MYVINIQYRKAVKFVSAFTQTSRNSIKKYYKIYFKAFFYHLENIHSLRYRLSTNLKKKRFFKMRQNEMWGKQSVQNCTLLCF